MSRALYEQDVTRRILALREDLVRHDENEKAMILMKHCVPYFLQAHPEILAARERQRQMCLHLMDSEAYAAYYATNVHERPFEEQYLGATVDNAHLPFHRVGFLRDRLFDHHAEAIAAGAPPRVLDVSCNDGWMAANLALAGITCDGIDLNPDCIQRAMARRERSDRELANGGAGVLMGAFMEADFIEIAHVARLQGELAFSHAQYQAVVCFETIEHVADPDAAVRALLWYCLPGYRLYVSTPNGTDHNGDLPGWDHVEPKGHVRVYTPESFHALLSRYGTVERMEQGPDRVMVAEVSL
jgi:2-polyprenyl-3-methyl-5-hydroxy-6-metoxy-1,4-benzoquinol methylase